jgi:chaperone required for assembly of F1-ATPase
MKKFYKTAEAGTAPGGHVVRLDGKVVKTPLGHPLIVESPALAAAMAAEWEAQGAEIIPSSMPITQLANTMADKSSRNGGKGQERPQMEQTLIDYGASDLVCYYALTPQELVQRQEKLWGPLLAWMKQEFGITLETVHGIQYHHQPRESLNKLALLVEGLSPAEFTITQAAAGAVGSLVIALALMRGKLTAQQAWEAACIDEIWQLEKWGEDAHARKRLDHILFELEAVARFRELV